MSRLQSKHEARRRRSLTERMYSEDSVTLYRLGKPTDTQLWLSQGIIDLLNLVILTSR